MTCIRLPGRPFRHVLLAMLLAVSFGIVAHGQTPPASDPPAPAHEAAATAGDRSQVIAEGCP